MPATLLLKKKDPLIDQKHSNQVHLRKGAVHYPLRK